jgi:chromosome segregation ATPase
MDTVKMGGLENPQQLQPLLSSHTRSPLIVLSPHGASLGKQPYRCLVRDDKADNARVKGALQLIAPNLGACAHNQQPDITNQPITPLRFWISRLPPPHIINSMEAGQLATVASLLTQRDMDILVMEVGPAELSTLISLGKVQAQRLDKNVYTFDQYAGERSAMSLQGLDTQQSEIVRLKHTLSEAQQQFDAQLKQRDIEKKLLSRALTVAKKRLKGDKHDTNTSTNLEQYSSTLGGQLRKEIEAMRLQLVKTQESKHESQLDGDSSIEQMQIATLQQSLNETQEALDQAKAAHQTREQELQAVLDETTSNAEQTAQAFVNELEQLQQTLEEESAQLSQAKAEQQEWESNLQAALEKEERSIEENKARYVAQIDGLQQQILTQESSLRQLTKEKAELASGLKAETQRALKFSQEAQSLDEHRRSLEHELETIQQTFSETDAQQQKDMALLKDELDQARHTIDELGQSRQQLNEALQQSRAQLQAQQEQERELQAALDESNSNAERTAETLGGELEQLHRRQTILQQTLEKSRAQLAQTQSELKQRESSLLSALDEAERSANERLTKSQAEISNLQRQIQIQESAHHKIAQEKAELANCLQVESSRALEFAGQAESLDEQRRSLEHELETIQQVSSETEAQHQKDMALLKEELELARHTIDELGQTRQQLESALQQTQAEFQAEQERLSQSLEVEKQHARQNVSRLNRLVKRLNSRLESISAKAIRQRKKRLKLEVMLAREQKTSEQLKQLMKSTENKSEIANNRLAKLERSQQELQTELQKEIEASQEAWGKASESDIALQTAKLEYASLKKELEQEIDNLRAQLEHQEESLGTIQSEHSVENERLQESLDEYQTELRMAQTTIRALKGDRERIREAKFEADEQLTQVEAKYRKEQAELIAARESNRQEVASLRQELADIKRLSDNPEAVEHLRQTLHQVEDEKAALKQQIAGLREVQLEMERQRDRDRDAEMASLRGALIVAEGKRKKAEKLAQQADTLRRECQVQEMAVETLSEDLEALTREKAALVDERDRLQRELSDIHAQPDR